MKKQGGFARLITAFLLCFAIIFGAAYVALNEVPAEGKKSTAVTEFVEVELTTAESATADAASIEQASSSVPQQEGESAAVAAKSEGEVKGEIIEKFISPYTAKTAYNNVYIKNSTELSVDIKSLLESPIGFDIKKNDEPQVLIIHTHTTETFMESDSETYTESDASRTNEQEKNMVHLGKIVADTLNEAGIKTVHDTTVHDFPKYSGSYTRAASTISSNLKKYPQIKIVLDIHRDAIASGDSDKVKLTTEIDGKKAAQVMLVMGSQSGGVTNFPSYEENLKLAVRYQQIMEVMYPSLARALSLTSKNYNESLTTGSMLLEIGTEANTLEEVRYSAQLAANALKSLLNTL